ncbi:GspH/FimT family pseudopilin [Marinicella meishanensis]|uniref:GspH/FimT family pseudopilin n=1 Tax=Marinicella meishanensis TaxID=2873263 RepID=UPI001CC0CF5E|nr:GspH/FimT family pseudopilin [Marinicella sp. NBU2979]
MIQKNKGFTLVELFVTLLVGSILLAWGVPSYRDFKIRKQVSDMSNEIVYSLTVARNEAIKQGVDVIVDRNGSNWRDGWQIFTLDELGNNDELVYVQPALPRNLKVTQSGGFTGDLIYNNVGALRGGLGTQFAIEDDPSVNGSTAISNNLRNILISPSGSARVVKP